jgi:coenzyme Q-binding protein COQ10
MPTHAEKKLVPYTSLQMYTLVANIEDYPEFLPWCSKVIILKKTEQEVVADLVIGYKIFKERFTSKVTLKPYHSIDVQYIQGPLKFLSNHWHFIEHDNNQCMLDFYVDFDFKTRFLQSLMEKFFNEAVKRMTHAFEKRAHDIYGKNS